MEILFLLIISISETAVTVAVLGFCLYG